MHNVDVLIKLPGIVSGNSSSIIYKIAFWISTLESLVFTGTQWAHSAHLNLSITYQYICTSNEEPTGPGKSLLGLSNLYFTWNFLVKATKHKADPATNEVRVENRNHGLAWSQSGNSKTVQTLLSFIIQKLLPGKEIHAAVKRLIILLSWEKTRSCSLLRHNAILHSWCSLSLSCISFS